ncbi:Trace amine-associated receptor 8c [Trichoplax sp. H2]|nr:Trace amine-associated receptor 8c [Trichoplax sp. H2]|eukprot:RDD42357.1 Trace amine-associated receptor 8c [Trichoplax sp. H2]
MQSECNEWNQSHCFCNQSETSFHITKIILRCIAPPVFILALGGNFLSVLVVYRKRSLHNPSGFLIATLAATEMATGLIVTCYFFAFSALHCGMLENFCIVLAYLSTTFVCFSHITVGLISIDRYIAITRPLHYPMYITNKRLSRILILSITHSCFCASLPLMNLNQIQLGRYQYVEYLSLCWIDITDLSENFIFLVIMYSALLMVICIVVSCYVLIFVKANQIHRKRRNLELTKSSVRHLSKKLTRTILIVITVYLIFIIPSTATILITLNHHRLFLSPTMSKIMTFWGLHIKIIINPLIFGFSHRDFRQSYNQLFYYLVKRRRTRIFDQVLRPSIQ